MYSFIAFRLYLSHLAKLSVSIYNINFPPQTVLYYCCAAAIVHHPAIFSAFCHTIFHSSHNHVRYEESGGKCCIELFFISLSLTHNLKGHFHLTAYIGRTEPLQSHEREGATGHEPLTLHYICTCICLDDFQLLEHYCILEDPRLFSPGQLT